MILSVLAGLVVVAVVILLSVPGSGSQPHRMESMFQDDQYLLYEPPDAVVRTLDALSSLGVDRLRVQVLWRAIAPGQDSLTKPAGFDASNPTDYPATGWAPYDRLVALARARGIAVDFNVTAPGPLWAMGRPLPPGADSKAAHHFRPSAADFAQFVTAVGRRYSGSYTPSGATGPLARVSYWTIWNEPNQPGWLLPQWSRQGGQPVMEAPSLYRDYADAAFGALRGTGHGVATDTILIGELAPEGADSFDPSTKSFGPITRSTAPIAPLRFVQALYCVDASYRPLRGALAGLLHCPTDGSAQAFVAAHPALFQATGFAHHPYSFFLAPGVDTSPSDPDFVSLIDLPRLEHGLDRTFAAYGVGRQLPIYLTEYGYETDPPNPFKGRFSPSQQALFLNQAQYMAWKDPRVRSLSQFLLVDSLPDTRYPRGSVKYWSTFQTGLLYASGALKPAFNAYRLPIFIPDPTFAGGQPTSIWGMLRAAPNNTHQRAQIQWRGPGGVYRTLRTVSIDDPSGFLSVRVQLPGIGAVRITWVSPSGRVVHSRAVGIRGA
ncbi:MAG: hypothetical protein ACR2OB_13770 [Solirubrobacteraceae bacterium]